jgi:hypothetical protein
VWFRNATIRSIIVNNRQVGNLTSLQFAMAKVKSLWIIGDGADGGACLLSANRVSSQSVFAYGRFTKKALPRRPRPRTGVVNGTSQAPAPVGLDNDSPAAVLVAPEFFPNGWLPELEWSGLAGDSDSSLSTTWYVDSDDNGWA